MTAQRKNRIRGLLQRRERAAAMAKIRRILGVGLALALVLIFLAIVVF
jgi:uncharacterized membrane protein